MSSWTWWGPSKRHGATNHDATCVPPQQPSENGHDKGFFFLGEFLVALMIGSYVWYVYLCLIPLKSTIIHVGKCTMHGSHGLRLGSKDHLEESSVIGSWRMLMFITQLPGKHTRWAPTSYKWGYSLFKWPYKWVTGVLTLLIRILTPFITSRRPTL